MAATTTRTPVPAPDDTPPPRHGPNRRSLVTIALGAALAVATAVAALLGLRPPNPSDQLNYLDAARDFPTGTGDEPAHQNMRIGLTLPIRLVMTVFGYSEASYHAVGILASVALVVAIYALGFHLFSRSVGLAAAVLMVGGTLVFDEIAVPMPDLPATALFCWALVLAVAVRQRRRWVGGVRRERLALVLVGVLLGWSYLTREYIVLAWPLIPLVLVRWSGLRASARELVGRLIWVASPMALIWIGETALNAAVYGDPLARLTASFGNSEVLGTAEYAADYPGHTRWWYLTRLPAVLYETPEGAWLLGALALAVVGGAVGWFVPDRRLRFLLGWMVLLFVPLALLGGVLDPAEPTLRLIKARYWYPLLPAMFLAAVAVVWLVTRAGVRRIQRLGPSVAGTVAGVVVLALAAVPVGLAWAPRDDTSAYRDGRTQLAELRAWLSEHGDEVPAIRVDARSKRVIAIYANEPFGAPVWRGRLLDLGPKERPKPGEYVVEYSAHHDACLLCYAAIRDALGDPPMEPANWERVFATEDGVVELYRAR